MEPKVGAVVEGYEIVGVLGSGGQSQVFKAIDVGLRRIVALKFLSANYVSDEMARKRFLLEARALSSLNHPSIATVFQIGEAQGRPFIAMEYVEGESLLQRLQRGAPGEEETLGLMLQITEAVGFAHRKGILHRDLKPGNIMITPEGRAKLLDFGLAKLTSDALRERISMAGELTSVGAVLGTVSYVSPEQAHGEEVDERSDLFSLGIVFYEMLSGRRPFAGQTPVATIMAIIRDPAPPLLLPPGMPEKLVTIVGCLLEKDRVKRYPSAHDLLADLAAVAGLPFDTNASSGSVTASLSRTSSPSRPSTPTPPLRTPMQSGAFGAVSLYRRPLVWVAIATVVVVAAVAFGRWWPGASGRGSPARGGLLVLPLQASGDPDRRGLAGLLTGQLIANLNRAPGLKVTTLPEGSFADRDKFESLLDRLDVRYVVDGNIGISGDNLIVTIKMVDRREANVLWSDTIRGRLDEVFTITSRMATGAAFAAGVVVAADQLQFPGREAFDFFARGSLASLSYDPSQLSIATEQLSRCIEIAPRFVPCYDRASRAFLQYRNLGVDYNPAYLDRAYELINRGLEIDPLSPELNSTLGWYRLYTYDFRGAWQTVKPFEHTGTTLARDLKLRGWMLLYRGDPDGALAAFEENRRTAPFDTSIHLNLVVLNAMLDRREAAESALAASQDFYASDMTRSISTGWAQVARKNLVGAASTFREAYEKGRFPMMSLAAAEADLANGDPERALFELEPWLEKNPYSLEAHWMACVAHMLRHDKVALGTAAIRGERWADELRARYPNPTVKLFYLYFQSLAGGKQPTPDEVRTIDFRDEAVLTTYLQLVTLARLGDRTAINQLATPYSPTFWFNRFSELELTHLRGH